MNKDIGTAFYQNGRHRAARRALRPMLRPPERELRLTHWHFIDTPKQRLMLQWRPGIEVWFDRQGVRYTAEQCAAAGWTYHSRADQIGPV